METAEAVLTLRARPLSEDLELHPDGLVRWTRLAKSHPRNWSFVRKSFDTAAIILLETFMSAMSTAGVPVAAAAREELGVGQTTSTFIFVSVYMIGQAFGGVLFPPYSECFGRRRLYFGCATLYGLSCLMVVVVPSVGGVVAGRFIGGILASAPTNVVGGSIEDLWSSRARTWVIYLWSMTANFGLVLGSIVGSQVVVSLGWRWIFYISAIGAEIFALVLAGIRESRPSLLLARKVVQFQSDTGKHFPVANPDHIPNWKTFVRVALLRPLHLLFAEPIVFIVSTMSAVAFGIVYLFIEALPHVYSSLGLAGTQATLPLLALGLGLMCGALTRCYDDYVLRARSRASRQPKPEDKLTGFVVGAPALAIGLWWFAWTIPPHMNAGWVLPTIALVLVGYSVNEFDSVLSGYLADSYLSYSASAFGAQALLRSVFSAVFPLFADKMFSGLGNNLAVSVLAALATVFCVAPPLFIRYGEQVRKRSPFATYSLSLSDHHLQFEESP